MFAVDDLSGSQIARRRGIVAAAAVPSDHNAANKQEERFMTRLPFYSDPVTRPSIPSRENAPITTLTRSPNLTMSALFENTIQYSCPRAWWMPERTDLSITARSTARLL